MANLEKNLGGKLKIAGRKVAQLNVLLELLLRRNSLMISEVPADTRVGKSHIWFGAPFPP